MKWGLAPKGPARIIGRMKLVGNFAKFTPPTVTNGRVYLATFSNVLRVYGLLN